MSNEVVTLDVREDISHGHEPFGKIMSTVARLRPEDKFRLIAPFEPVPIFSVLAKKGFSHVSQQLESGDWEVLFTPGSQPEARTEPGSRALSSADSAGKANRPSSFVDVDARGLEPPQPMVKILEALASLPAGSGLRARTDRRPMHLYSHLEERGFFNESTEQSDGSFLTHIWPR